MSAAMAAARVGASGAWVRMIAERGSPSTYSMTMKYVRSASPQSKTGTMFGCDRFAAACASRRKRSTNEWSDDSSGKSIFKRHRAVEQQVVREVDLGGPAAGDLAAELVAAVVDRRW